MNTLARILWLTANLAALPVIAWRAFRRGFLAVKSVSSRPAIH